MFRLLDDLAKSVVDATTTVVGFAVDTAENIVLEPFHTLADAMDFLDGLSEGEIREDAAIRFVGRYVEGMLMSEVIELYKEGFD